MLKFTKFKIRPDKRAAFLQGFLKRPEQVGSVIPSSRFLERRILQHAKVNDANVVVELGPGTGGTTRAILREMSKDAKLLAIEINPDFLEIVRAIPDQRLIVHNGSAVDLGAILTEHGLNAPDVVISGIPFSTMSATLGRSIVESVYQSLGSMGRFVAYQFRDRVGLHGNSVFGTAQVSLELRNIPPMRVFLWSKGGKQNGQWVKDKQPEPASVSMVSSS